MLVFLLLIGIIVFFGLVINITDKKRKRQLREYRAVENSSTLEVTGWLTRFDEVNQNCRVYTSTSYIVEPQFETCGCDGEGMCARHIDEMVKTHHIPPVPPIIDPNDSFWTNFNSPAGPVDDFIARSEPVHSYDPPTNTFEPPSTSYEPPSESWSSSSDCSSDSDSGFSGGGGGDSW